MEASNVDIVRDLQMIAVWMVIIGVIDIACQKLGWFPEKKSNSRYFTLHVIVNAYVTDVIASYQDPAMAAFGPTDTRGSVAIYALHLYHMLFYRPLPMIDWIHHFVMVVVMLPLAYCLDPGHLLGHGSFYASGFPGGLDYLMLVLVKRGWMDSITEKRYNENIQLWIRAPGCMAHAMLTWLNYVEANKRLAAGVPVRVPLFLPEWAYSISVWIVITTFFWNGQFFLQRVIASYTTHTLRSKSPELKAQGSKTE